PAEIDPFRELLSARGIPAELVAERIDVDRHVAAEAALGEHVWALVVSKERNAEAVALAVEQQYRLPIGAAGGAGAPAGALRGARGLDDAAALLAELDLPLDAAPGVSADGLVRGRDWAWLRTRLQPLLGPQARAAALASRKARLHELEQSLPQL